MIVLANTDSVRLAMSEPVDNIDVVAQWADLDAGVVTQGVTKSRFSSGASNVVVAPPSGSAMRNVKSIRMMNRDRFGSTPSTQVTVGIFDGSDTYEMINGVLRPSCALQYEEGDGWRAFRESGEVDSIISDDIGFAVSLDWKRVVVASPVVALNTSANIPVETNALRWPVLQGNNYYFRYDLHYSADLTTTGSRWAINGPLGIGALRMRSRYSLTTTTRTRNEGVSAYNFPTTSNATSASTGVNFAQLEGFLVGVNYSGWVTLLFASEVANRAVTLLPGSTCLWTRTS